jgi:ABC-2 type transport system permease protein
MDPQNAPFPVPVEEQRGRFRVQRVEMLPYPFFPDVRADGMAKGHPALVGLQNVTTPWASPLTVSPPDGVTAEVLLESSDESWLDPSGRIEPDLRRFPEGGFGPGPETETGSAVLAVSLTGVFPSHFADRDDPSQPPADAPAEPPAPLLEDSLPDARLTVIGSSEIVSDLIVGLASRMGGEVHRSNLQLLQNVIDWSLEDTDLLAIRSSGSFTRTLAPLDETQARAWELSCYGVSLLLLVVVIGVARRLGRVQPLRPAAEARA